VIAFRFSSALVGLAVCASAEAPSPWSFVPSDSAIVMAMEWRKVIGSPYRDAIRREIPPAAAPYLNGINFIQGIDRVLIALQDKSPLIVLNGRMDPEKLRQMAMADGGKSQKYKGAELLLSTDDAASDTQMAVLSDSTVLLGDRATLMGAIDRSASARRGETNPALGYDLWVRSHAPAPGIAWDDFGLVLGPDGIRIDSHLHAGSEELARALATNARIQDMIATQTGSDVHIMANITRDEFARKPGQWRSSLEELIAAPASAPAAVGGQTIRIYGLEGGTREVTLGSPK
jgi:hypothetical protein